MPETPLRARHQSWVRQQAAATHAVVDPVERPGAARGHRTAPDDIEYLPYGPAGGPACAIPAAFGPVELEYAAIRRAAGLLDCPQRATLRVTGADRLDFLDRMLTQAMKDMRPGDAREAFWLTRKGRIEADLLVVELGAHALIDVDMHQAAATVKSLSDHVFTEDVEIDDVSDDHHRLAVHGPQALNVLAVACGRTPFTLEPLHASGEFIADAEVCVARRDQAAVVGLELFVERSAAGRVWDALLATDEAVSGSRGRVRPVGWYAWNVARLESGTPLLNIDFAQTNLPNESGALARRVSFKKGCYPGQEIVARVENLGQPRQTLVGLRMDGDALPVSGAAVYAVDEGRCGDPVGMVTSSAISPLLGSQPIAFAMIRTAAATMGGRLLIEAEGRHVEAIVRGLQFVGEDGTPLVDD